MKSAEENYWDESKIFPFTISFLNLALTMNCTVTVVIEGKACTGLAMVAADTDNNGNCYYFEAYPMINVYF